MIDLTKDKKKLIKEAREHANSSLQIYLSEGRNAFVVDGSLNELANAIAIAMVEDEDFSQAIKLAAIRYFIETRSDGTI